MSDARVELQLFVAEVERLLSRTFIAQFQAEDVCFSDIQSIDTSPSIEQLESFVLHFRKFMQENDRVAVTRVREHFEELAPSMQVVGEWNQLQSTFDEMKNKTSISSRSLTLREVYRARTIGDLSHLDAKQRKTHEMLGASPESDALYRFEYSTFLAETAELLGGMARLCKQVLSASA